MRRKFGLVDWYGFKVYPWNLPLPLPGVYRITDLTCSKYYVGSSFNIEQRFSNGHKRDPVKSTLLSTAMKVRGRDRFLVEPLYYALTRMPLWPVEEALILQHRSMHPDGYNQVLAGNPERIFNAIYTDPVLEQRRTASIVAYAKTTEAQQRFRAQWNDEAIQAKATRNRLASPTWRRFARSEENAQHLAEQRQALHADPDIEQRRIANTTRTWQDEALREQQRQRRLEYLADPKHRKAHAKQARKAQVAATEAAAAKVKGSMWITNGEVGKRVPTDTDIPEGWRRGKPDYRSTTELEE